MYTGRYTATDRQFVKEAECVSVQYVYINFERKHIEVHDTMELLDLPFGNFLPDDKALQFARNDGFDTLEDFWQWFTTTQTLKLIHWTDKRY